MARRRQPKAGGYSASYTRRIVARYGVTPEQAAERGIDIRAGRGHRRIVGEPAEKAKLDIRRRERGELTDRERRFAKKQAERLNRDEDEVREDMQLMAPEDRDLLITTQSRAERLYNRRSGYRWDLDPGQPFPFPHFSPFKTLYYYH